MRQTLQNIQTSQSTSHQTSLQQAEKLDGVLAAIQSSLLNITTSNNTRTQGRRSRKTCYRSRTAFDIEKSKGLSIRRDLSHDTPESSIAEVQLNRVVDLAFTVRYRCGKAQFKTIAVPDPVFEKADWETNLRMVKYLQDLRLLLWFLRRDTYSVNGLSAFRYMDSSSSYCISEMSLVSSWTFSWVRQFVYKHITEIITPIPEDFGEPCAASVSGWGFRNRQEAITFPLSLAGNVQVENGIGLDYLTVVNSVELGSVS